MIPKIIHYCWFGGNPEPKNVEKYIESWKKYCPDYEIKEWNESNFDLNENTYCKEAYEAKKWAFITDYVRLKALYEYGGFYMDTDVEVVKSLEPLRIFDAVSGYEAPTRIPTGTMGSCRDNEWIGMLLRYYDNRHFLKKDGSFDLTTNVEVITHLTSQKYGLVFDGEKKTFGNNMVLLPFDYLCAKDMNTGKVKVTDNTFTIHHFTGSWFTKHEQTIRKFYKVVNSIFGMQVGNIITKPVHWEEGARLRIKKYGIRKTIEIYKKKIFD